MEEERKSLMQGAAINNDSDDEDSLRPTTVNLEPDDDDDKKSNKCGWVIAGIAVVALILLGVILFVTEEKKVKKGINRYTLDSFRESDWMYIANLTTTEKSTEKRLPINPSSTNPEFAKLGFIMDMPSKDSFRWTYIPLVDGQP